MQKRIEIIGFTEHFSENWNKIRDNINSFKRFNEIEDEVSLTLYFQDTMPIYFHKSNAWVKKITLQIYNIEKHNLFNYYYKKTGAKKGKPCNELPLHSVVKAVVSYKSIESKTECSLETKRKRQITKILNERFDGCWSDLNSKTDFIKVNEVEVQNINEVITKELQDSIQIAFELKESFCFNISRSYTECTLEGKLDKDGVYRAYYTEESSFYDFGHYYYLLNPNIALLIERD